jgi:hypothetical protein
MPASAATAPVVTPTAGAPTGVTASAGVRSASVFWTAPSKVGTSPISKYTVQWSVSSSFTGTVGSADTTTTSTTLSDLADNTAYYVRVAANNASGVGTWSSGVKVAIFVTVFSSLSFSSNLICLEVIVEHLSHPTFKKPENAVNINQLQYAQSTKK